MNINHIPQVLKEKGLFCVWKYNDTQGKVPYNPLTNQMAKTNDRTTFTDFKTAYDSFSKNQYKGLGLGIFDGFGAIDIDHCISSNGISEMALDIVNTIKSYTEISPSSKGIRIIFKTENFSYDKEKYLIMNHKKGVEIYVPNVTSKYVTITGNTFKYKEIVTINNELLQVLERYMKRTNRVNTPNNIPSSTTRTKTNQEYLEIGLQKDKKLKEYWSGSRLLDKSESENDFGFMRKLMFWTNNDEMLSIQTFSSSPYSLQKDEKHKKKLQRKDYLPNLARAAILSVTAEQKNTEWREKNMNTTPPKPTETIELKSRENMISAKMLQEIELPPLKYLVEDILPEGTSILVAPSKIGKSWLVLDMGLSIAGGQSFLGKKTEPVGVLYFALEDSLRRLQDRMKKVLGKRSIPEHFYIQTRIDSEDHQFLSCLKECLKTYKDIKFIIIDTLGKIRGQALPRETAYQQDYREIGQIKEFADDNNLSVLFVHHTRKMKDSSDPFNMISGTNGIMGAADTIWVINKDNRTDNRSILHITGRDVQENDIVIHQDKMDCRWKIDGDFSEIEEQEKKREYLENPLVMTIKNLLTNSENRQWKGTATTFLDYCQTLTGISPCTPKKLSSELSELKSALCQYDKIIYQSLSNGNAGKIHFFKYIYPVINTPDTSLITTITSEDDFPENVEF